MTREAARTIHSVLVAIGTGVAAFLTATFATGLPATQAAWRGLLLGCISAGLSSGFGWWLRRLQAAPPPAGG